LAATISVAKVGHFDEVLKAIDTMIGTLKTEEQEDITKRDECIETYKNINSTVADHTWKVEVNDAKITKLESQIETAETEKANTLTSIEEVKQEIIDMTEQRTNENQAFLQAKKDDEDAIVLLKEAKEVLSAYYVKNTNVSVDLLQQPEFEVSEDQAPDATFSDKAKRGGESKGIISILTMIIEDLGGEIKVLQQDEESAQLAFEAALKAAQTLQGELEDKVVTLEGVIADKGELKLEEEELKKTNTETIETEEAYRTKIQPDCDWIIGKFDMRRSKRADEMAGLVQAKEFLAGYQPAGDSELVQKGSAPNSLRGSSRV